MASTFSVGGLASGMDTQSIIDQLVTLESRPLTLLKQRRSAFQAQISTLGDIASKLSALGTAAKALGDGGVIASKVTSTNTSFTATPGSGAAAGSYQVTVQELARASKWRSAAFDPADRVAGGTLTLTVQGTTLPGIAVAEGATLREVADAIRASGAAVSATVLDDGARSYLSVTSTATGHPLAGTPADALQLAFTPNAGATGKLPALAETQGALNAVVEVDGITYTRRSNVLSDVLPGTTLTLKAKTGAAEDLVLETDAAASKANLQKLVDAYNAVMKLVQRELAPTANTDRQRTLTGDSTLRALQARLQAIVTTAVPGMSGVRSLADVGVKTARDGSLSIDETTFNRVLASTPDAMNALFANASGGIAATVKTLVDLQTRAADGALTLRQKGLGDTVKRLDADEAAMQRRLEAFRENLVRQFTAMEEAVSRSKSIGNYLTSQEKASSSGSNT